MQNTKHWQYPLCIPRNVSVCPCCSFDSYCDVSWIYVWRFNCDSVSSVDSNRFYDGDMYFNSWCHLSLCALLLVGWLVMTHGQSPHCCFNMRTALCSFFCIDEVHLQGLSVKGPSPCRKAVFCSEFRPCRRDLARWHNLQKTKWSRS